jgi:hypothetical protein
MNFCKLFVDRDGIVQSFSGKHFHLSVTKSWNFWTPPNKKVPVLPVHFCKFYDTKVSNCHGKKFIIRRKLFNLSVSTNFFPKSASMQLEYDTFAGTGTGTARRNNLCLFFPSILYRYRAAIL